jgi:hypothetical protein
MGLNLSNTQIAYELDSSQNDVYKMTCELRQAMVEKKPEVELSGEVEFDEVYVTAGHKGQPETVQKIHAFPHCQTVTPVIELKVCEQIGGEAIAS